MLYRVRQFVAALFPHLRPEELQHIRKLLSAQAYALFSRQPLTDQRHALDVTRILENCDLELSADERENLLQAALLHDCGKSYFTLRLWQRVFIVLVQKCPQALRTRFAHRPRPLAFPLRLAARHAAWGSRLAHRAGLNETVCRLIREHHQPYTPLGQLLHKADNRC